MKKFHLYFFITLLFSCAVNASDFGLYALKLQLQKAVDTQQPRELLSSLRAFQRLRMESPSRLNWLVDHYIGLNHYRLATYYHHIANNDESAKKFYQEGLEALKKSANQQQFAETYALISAINGNLIPLSWWWSKISLGIKSGDHIEKARKAGPQNPRVWLLSGIGRIFTPETYGGGNEPALRDLNKSIKLFENQGDSLTEILPSWGKDEAYYWKGIVLQKLGREREAQAFFQKAIMINPKNALALSKIK